ncbi:hypothetical protein GCM10012275_63230 [Longimycelium tulufanense]|uniref:Uncharacterized protein n=1 Tax=Longimycelium tulufanense TaxID=907463 RepID=A0A8J3FYQ3_9PSEU|nr:hypothetical protein [Longimycelium tulufanense]GGM83972.1 hypothetical protein GCM10012275_63230 [Longimycelium tulufanense]
MEKGTAVPEWTSLDEQLRALRQAQAAEQPIPAGRLLGLPELPDGDVWVDAAGASAVTRCAPKTISGWLARRNPADNPFPKPVRLLYRNYWPLSVLTAWQARERELDGTPARRRGRPLL